MVAFAAWFEAARAAGVREAEAMTLATASPDGAPSARMVLLKSASQDGFRFFTNRESRKGRELLANPRAALVMHWDPLGRQVRVEGPVEELPRAEVEEYFTSRPRGSRIGAWASRQSTVIAGREVLEARLDEARDRFGDGDIPLPGWWSGFVLRHRVVEFWQHREDRLHDRIAYRRDPAGEGWIRERLSP